MIPLTHLSAESFVRKASQPADMAAATWKESASFRLCGNHISPRAVPEGPSRSIARGPWPQVEGQGAAYQTEGEARRDERNQHGGREARKDDE